MANSYIINSFRVPETVKGFILDNLLTNYSKPTQEFFVHVLFGTLNSYHKKEDGWVPVCSELMRKHWGRLKPDWELLIADKLIEIKILGKLEIAEGIFIDQTYSYKGEISRCFKVTLEIIDKFLNSYPTCTENFTSCQYFNLMTGKKMNVFKRHKLTDDTGHPLPELVKNSILSIKRCIINDKAVKEYFEDKQLELIFSGGFKEEMKLRNDDFCYKSLRKTGIKLLPNGLLEYYPSYKTQMSGRISEEGGGLQSCSREMKEAAFKGLDDVRNYDLKSSQVWGLIQWFERANINTDWLTEYLHSDKQTYADKVGISKDRWKECFMALVFAAQLSKKVSKKELDAPETAILKALSEEAEGNQQLALEYYTKFYEVVSPLKKGIDEWQNWLLSDYLRENSVYGKGIQYAINKTGTSFCLGNYQNSKGDWVKVNELKRKISAFYLQGSEAAFIHHLTWVSGYYGYEVISNQHDGVVTIGAIPKEAIEKARINSGLKYAFLEEKPFI